MRPLGCQDLSALIRQPLFTTNYFLRTIHVKIHLNKEPSSSKGDGTVLSIETVVIGVEDEMVEVEEPRNMKSLCYHERQCSSKEKVESQECICIFNLNLKF